MSGLSTKDGVEVAVGQRWRDCDKRMRGRVRTIDAISNGKVRMIPGRTWVSISRMYKHSTGWELVL